MAVAASAASRLARAAAPPAVRRLMSLSSPTSGMMTSASTLVLCSPSSSAAIRSFYTNTRSTASPTPSRTVRTTKTAATTASRASPTFAKPKAAAAAASATSPPPPPPTQSPLPPLPTIDASSPQPPPQPDTPTVDWSASFHGLSTVAFPPDVAAKLMTPIDEEDVEVKPDGILYLPEIKYRRILNTAFGPGGWGLAPRGELAVSEKIVSREFALVVHGRYVSQARGECNYFGSEDGVATASEGCKSNALMRCCKDLGVASELWDPRFIRRFKQQHCREVWVEHVATKKRRQIWLRKDCGPQYPYALPAGK